MSNEKILFVLAKKNNAISTTPKSKILPSFIDSLCTIANKLLIEKKGSHIYSVDPSDSKQQILIHEEQNFYKIDDTPNFIYEVVGDGSPDIEEINAINESPRLKHIIDEIEARGFKLVYRGIQSDTFKLNLQMIDSNLPELIAKILLLDYSGYGSSISQLLELIQQQNPLGFDLSKGHLFYEYKIKSFLTDSALGMVPASTWSGQYHATGGIIFVKQSGDLVCYHIYNRHEFQEYLLKNTKLEHPSTNRHDYGKLYRENGKTLLKLNLQIRFI